MTSPADKKNQETPRQMRPVLYPTRRFAIASRDGFAGTLSNNPFASQGDNDPNAVEWIGMNPLEMITHFARATEEAETAKGYPVGPISVGDTKLSSETPPIPELSKESDRCKKKRGVKHIETTATLNDPAPLPPWDLSFLVAKDEHAAEPVKHLQFLACTVESMPHYALVGGSYQRIRDHVTASASWIHASYSGQLTAQSTAEKMSLLQNLYAETIKQMESLYEMTRMLGPTETEDVEPDEQPSYKHELSSREFAEYMTNWMIMHWTNPYPDDAALEMMADECGKTVTVVSNWLINARTRKWRPSIVKAFELKRPANLLLEDSINLFEDKPLRDLTEYEASEMGRQLPPNKRRKYY